MKLFIIICVLFPMIARGNAAHFEATITQIPPAIQHNMEKHSWHPGCPVPLTDLRYIKMKYWGFDNQPHMGELIVHRSLANEMKQMFKELYEHRFPIEKMVLVDEFQGDDGVSMSANNTSAFNCRDTTGLPGVLSQHSYGRAIDINPKINPYIKGKKILPNNGIPFADRHIPAPGKITKNSFIAKLFIQNGWDWAGDRKDLQDYQHFEKRDSGKKRNPY